MYNLLQQTTQTNTQFSQKRYHFYPIRHCCVKKECLNLACILNSSWNKQIANLENMDINYTYQILEL